MWTARNFGADEVLSAVEILCVFQSGQAHRCAKRPGVPPTRYFESQPKNKKGAGRERLFAPLYTRFAFERWFAVIQLEIGTILLSSGQNLAAVGSGHSLAEAMDFGSVTTAGLIGTLHSVHLLS